MNAAPDVLRWTAPGLDAPPPSTAEPRPSVESLQAIERAAREEGYARGHAEGLASGQAEVRRMVAQMEGILDGFTRPLARLDAEVGDALAALAVRVAGALLGRAYVADPALMADLVHGALDAMGATTRDVELRLHPDDLGVLAPHLAALDGVRLAGDGTLARGELRLHGESVRIDGTLSARLHACLQSILEQHEAAP
ncbi:FliH/SctL family protein [Luteimonas pelagia]